MARIRIHQKSKDKLDEATDLIEGTKSGIASQAIENYADNIIEEYGDENNE